MNITKKYSFYYDYTGFYGYTDSSHEIEVYNINQNFLLKDFFSIEDLDDNDIYQKQQEAEDYIYKSYYNQEQGVMYDFNIRFAHFILETCFDYYIEYIDELLRPEGRSFLANCHTTTVQSGGLRLIHSLEQLTQHCSNFMTFHHHGD